MRIPLRTLDLRVRGHVVGCGIQGLDCLAIELSQAKGGKWAVGWTRAGRLDDGIFMKELAKLTGSRHFWTPPSEDGGPQIETARSIEITESAHRRRTVRENFFKTQLSSCFVNEAIVIGGLRMRGAAAKSGAPAAKPHDVGGGAIRDNVKGDYRRWYSGVGIHRPHIASTSMALANTYLALYPEELRRANPLRLVILEGSYAYHAILMDDWRYVGDVHLPRLDGDNADRSVIEARVNGWIGDFKKFRMDAVGDREIVPLDIVVSPESASGYERWDFWGEYAMDRVSMTAETATPILEHRDLAAVAFGMALQGGC